MNRTLFIILTLAFYMLSPALSQEAAVTPEYPRRWEKPWRPSVKPRTKRKSKDSWRDRALYRSRPQSNSLLSTMKSWEMEEQSVRESGSKGICGKHAVFIACILNRKGSKIR